MNDVSSTIPIELSCLEIISVPDVLLYSVIFDGLFSKTMFHCIELNMLIFFDAYIITFQCGWYGYDTVSYIQDTVKS